MMSTSWWGTQDGYQACEIHRIICLGEVNKTEIHMQGFGTLLLSLLSDG